MFFKATVILFLKLVLTVNAIEDGDIRLFGSVSGNQGNILVFHNGICANVVCRSLGYLSALKATQGSVFGVSNHRIWLDNVQCNGNESTILDCERNEFGDNDCSVNELAGVHCKGNALNNYPLAKKKQANSETISGNKTDKSNRLNIIDAMRNNTLKLKNIINFINTTGNYSFDALQNITLNNISMEFIQNETLSSGIIQILQEIIILSSSDNLRDDTVLSIKQSLLDLRKTVNNTDLLNELNLKDFYELLSEGRSDETDLLGISLNDVFLVNGHRDNQGTILINYKGKTGYLCGETFTYNVAKVICGSLHHGYVNAFLQYGFFGGDSNNILIDGLICNGNESHLGKCKLDKKAKCPRTYNGVAGVQCTKKLPDILLDLNLLRRDFYIEDRTLHNLQCAMEEFCLQPSAYKEILEPDGYYKFRRLLRFTAAIINNGTAPFRPSIPKHMWQWHMCHMHFHSMDQFAIYQILDAESGKELLSGHKPSFCLEDNVCDKGYKPSFACASYGDQGISPKCVDIYLHSIDCQWVDITGLKAGNYKFRITVNPDMKVMELDYNNNALECDWWYDGVSSQRLGKCEYKKSPLYA